MLPRTLNFDETNALSRFESTETHEKSHDTRVYNVTVLFSSQEERTLEPKRISNPFPGNHNCEGKYRIKLFKSKQNKINVEIMYVHNQCISPEARHQCHLSIALKANSKIVYRADNLSLNLKCHTWRQLTTVNGKLNDRFKFSIKVNTSIQPEALTFESLDEDSVKDFTIQGTNGFTRKVHKSVLTYSSAVFRRIVKKTNKNFINLKADSVTLSEFIDYMYFGKLPQSNLTQVLKLARQFEMKDLANKCIAELYYSVNVYNALNMLNFAMANDCPSLVFGIVYFIKFHCEEIVNENVKTMSNSVSTKNDILNSFVKDYVDSASEVLAIKKELFPNDE